MRQSLETDAMSDTRQLPPGQEPRADMPAFGLPWYAHRMPAPGAPVAITVGGLVHAPFTVDAAALTALPRLHQTSDFHCVTMWTRRDASWEGVRFADVYEQLLRPHLRADRSVERVRIRGADGYGDDLPLVDMLASDALLADTLDGTLLSRANGAPIRLVVPAHYGYKNVKYVTHIDLLGPRRRDPLITLHHPRARHAHEERIPYPISQRAVGIIYKLTLRRSTRWWFRRMMSR